MFNVCTDLSSAFQDYTCKTNIGTALFGLQTSPCTVELWIGRVNGIWLEWTE